MIQERILADKRKHPTKIFVFVERNFRSWKSVPMNGYESRTIKKKIFQNYLRKF